MSSRERILATLPYQTPDHMSLDRDSTLASSIRQKANNRFKMYLGIQADEPVHDTVQVLVVPYEGISHRFGVDLSREARRPPSNKAV